MEALHSISSPASGEGSCRPCPQLEEAGRSRDYLTRLQTITAALSAAVTPAQVATVILELGLAALGVHAAVLALLVEDGAAVDMDMITRLQGKRRIRHRHFTVAAGDPMAEAMRLQEALHGDAAEDWLGRFPHMTAMVAITRSKAVAIVPLVAEGCVLGLAGLGYEEPRPFDRDERAFISILLGQCAQALARARHREESRLQAAWLETVFTTVADAVLLCDTEGMVRRSNGAVAEALGFDPIGLAWEEVRARLDLRRLSGEAVARAELPGVDAAWVGGCEREYIRVGTPSGRTFTALTSVAPVVVDGATVGVTISYHDFAVRERLLDAHSRQRELLARLIGEAPIGIAVLEGPEHRCVVANPAIGRLIRAGKQLVGRTVAEIWPEVAGEIVPVLDAVCRSGQPYREVDAPAAVVRERGPKEACFTLGLCPLPDGAGFSDGILLLMQETTEQVRLRRRADALASMAVALNIGRGLPEVLQTTLTKVTSLLGGEDGLLFLLEEDGYRLRCAYELQAEGRIGLTLEARDCTHLGRALAIMEPVYYTSHVSVPAEAALFKYPGIWGCLALPLVFNGQSIGLISVHFHQEDYAFLPEDAAFAESMAAQCALAIERERVHDERTRFLARQRQAQDEAERQAAQMRGILENLHEGVVVFDAAGRLILRNQMARMLTGAPDAQPPYRPYQDGLRLLWPDGTVVADERQPVSRLRKGESFTNLEFLLERPDRGRWRILVSGNIVRDGEGRSDLAIITLHDVTELRRLEEERENYLHVISHDLRSPLAVVLCCAQLAEQSADKPERVRESARTIVKAARRMSGFLQDLVDSARLESGQLQLKKQEIDLRAFVLDLLEQHQEVMDVARVSVETPSHLPPVLADPDRLTRILINLLSNAFKYSDTDKRIAVTLSCHDDEVVAAVTDRGQGISGEDLPQLFRRYFRTRQARECEEGIGLGLYITKGLVEAHGGRIWVESTPGTGSTFYFSLPVVG